jgi:hypothetical protein
VVEFFTDNEPDYSCQFMDKIEGLIFGFEECVFKKCCEKYKRKRKYCKKCPKK